MRAARLAAGAVAAGLVLSACATSATSPGAGNGNGNGMVRIAAAADLQFALEEIAEVAAEQRPDLEITTTYGSSGTFLQQIVNGAPFDLYLSADLSYPRELVDRGLASEEDLFSYAIGRLVVWLPEGSSLRPTPDLSVLANPAIRTVSIANPEHAPYGVAAVEAMRFFEAYQDVEPKLVLGENVAQAAEFVLSGNADAGIVALSLVLAPAIADEGSWERVPLRSFSRLNQGGVVLSSSQDPDAARAVRDVLLGEDGRQILARYGFSMPRSS